MSVIDNKNAVFALKCTAAKISKAGPPSLSLIGGQSFTLGMLFRCESIGGQSILIRQQDGFELGLQDGLPYYKAPGLGAGFFGAQPVPVEKDVWSAVYVSYSKLEESLYLYVNGVCVGEWTNVRGDTAVPASPYLLGETLQGYIQWIRLYDRSLTDEQICSDPFAQPEELLPLFLDFTHAKPLDRGASAFPIQEEEKNHRATALRPAEGGAAFAHNRDDLHQLFTSSSYTILQNLYLERAQDVVTDSFICGNLIISFQIGLQKFGKARATLNLFSAEQSEILTINGEAPYDTWFQAACSYDSQKQTMTFFIDGVQAGQIPFSGGTSIDVPVSFGGSNGAIFHGMIRDTAVFSRALGQAEINAYCQIPPSLSDDGLFGLYSFCTGEASERKSRVPIDLKEPFRLADLSEEPTALAVQTTGAACPVHVDSPSQFEEGIAIWGRVLPFRSKDNVYSIVYSHGTSGSMGRIQAGLIKRSGENGARLYFSIGWFGITLTKGPLIPFEKWLHFLVRYQKSTRQIEFYVNGTLLDTTTASADPDPAVNVVIGNIADRTRPFSGWIDQVAVYRSYLSQIPLVSNQNQMPDLNFMGLQALYAFNGQAVEQKSGQPVALTGDCGLAPTHEPNWSLLDSTYFTQTGAGGAAPSNAAEITRIAATGTYSILARVYPLKMAEKVNYRYLFKVHADNSPLLLFVYFTDYEEYQTLEFASFGNFSFAHDQMAVQLPYNRWATVGIICNQCNVQLYLNGVLIRNGNFNMKKPDVDLEKNSVWIGSDVNGLYPYMGKIAWLSLFDKALDVQEISRYSLQPPPPSANGLVSGYTFAHGQPIDEKSGQAVALTGGAYLEKHRRPLTILRSTNLVQALSVSQSGCALDKEPAGVSAAMSGGSYTLCATVWIPPQLSATCVLLDFVPEEALKEQGFCIALRRNNALLLEVWQGKLLGPSVEISEEEGTGWLQIALVYAADTSQLTVYLNGALQKIYLNVPANVPFQKAYFGNNSTLQFPFSGCVDSVAVYHQAYSTSDLGRLIFSPAFLSDEGLTALYDFGAAKPAELLSGRDLPLTEGASVKLRENTQDRDCRPPEPYLGGNHPYSPPMHWAACLAYQAGLGLPLLAFSVVPRPETLVGGNGGVPGIPPFYGSVVSILLQYGYHLPEIHRLASEHPHVTAESVENAFSSLTKAGLLTSLTKAFFPACAGLVRDIWGWYLFSQALDPVKRVTSSLAQKTADQINALPAAPELSYQLKINSIAFHHELGEAPQGSLGLRPDARHAAPSPEWTQSANSAENPSVAVYAADSAADEPFLNVEFEYTSGHGTEQTLIIEAVSLNDGILGNAKLELNVSESGTYLQKVTLRDHKLKASNPGWYQNTFVWRFVTDGVPQCITTHHSICLLNQTPQSPWSAVDPNRYLTLAALETREKILDMYRNQAESVPDCLSMENIAYYVNRWIRISRLFTQSEEGKNRFTGFSETGTLFFDRDEFDRQILAASADAPIPVTALDCSAILADCVRLEGYADFGIAKLVTGLKSFHVTATNGEMPVPIRDGDWEYDIPLRMNRVLTLGGNEFQIVDRVAAHYAAVSPARRDLPMQNRKVYDAFYAFQNGALTEISEGKPFTSLETSFTGAMSPLTYRETSFESGSCCVPHLLKDWTHGTPPAPIVPNGAKAPGGLIHLLPAKQGNVEGWIRDALRPGDSKELCGQLSWEAIRRIIGKCAVSLYSGKWTRQNFINCLSVAAQSLYTGIPQDVTQLDPRLLSLYIQTFRTIDSAAQALTQPSPDGEQITGLLTLLAHQLFNAFYAVRAGNPSWIQAADCAFDLTGWVYLQTDGSGSAVTGSYDAFAFPLHTQASQYELFRLAEPKASGFYLTNDTDAARLEPLFRQNFIWHDLELPWFSMGAFGRQDGKDFKFLFSSSNQFALPGKQSIFAAHEPVYARLPSNPSNWTLLWTGPAIKQEL